MDQYDAIVAYITGGITIEEFNAICPATYTLTAQDLADMKNDADRELFGSGSAY